MSFVIATPEMLTTAATDLAKIGSTITAANTAAAAVAKVLPASADEVSVAVAALFGTHAQEYQTVSAQVATFHDRFVDSALPSGALHGRLEFIRQVDRRLVHIRMVLPVAPYILLRHQLVGVAANPDRIYGEGMTDQSYAVDIAHPPAALLRLVNPILRSLLHTPLAGPLRTQLMVVSFTGRKTGRHFSIPLSAHVIDNDLYALTEAGWKHNFSDGAAAQVVYDGKTTAMRGELIRDRAVVSELFLRAAQAYGVKRGQRMLGLSFRDRRIPTLEEFAEAVDRLKLVAIRLTPADNS